LPVPSAAGDKEERGRVLVIAGSRELPGAAVLAGTAALRAGAGKLVIATAHSVTTGVAIAVPEARVVGLAETTMGGLVCDEPQLLRDLAMQADTILVGPGMQDEASANALVVDLLRDLGNAKVILDALAMIAVLELRDGAGRRSVASDDRHKVPSLLLTPHAGEMAHLTATDKARVQRDPQSAACSAALQWNAVVALKGAATFIALPDGPVWKHDGGNVGLAVSGSGDSLAGIIAGLAARGATLEQAAAWGVALHARAGERLARRVGPIGYLAREIADEIPALMQSLES
jgi:ADP-dependent NAD(P)H-hydrate dehydratase